MALLGVLSATPIGDELTANQSQVKTFDKHNDVFFKLVVVAVATGRD